MKIRKVGRVKASEVKEYQYANVLKVDGKVGNQTFGHLVDTNASLKTTVEELKIELSLCRQPDDPGPVDPPPGQPPMPSLKVFGLIALAIAGAVLAFIF